MLRVCFYLSLILSALIITGCATADYSNYGYQVNEDNTGKSKKNPKTELGLIVSAQDDGVFESNYFGVINFSFVNTSQEWIYIKNIRIDFGDDAKNDNIKIISGNDIVTWRDSTMLRNNIDEHNMNLFLGTLAVTGAVLSVSGNKNVKTAGQAMLLGAEGSLTVKALSDSYDKIQFSTIFPQSHLLNSDFAIPPGLFVRKWVVLNTKNHDKTGPITSLDIEYLTENNKKEKVRIFLGERVRQWTNTEAGLPHWQNDIFLKQIRLH